MTTRITRGNAAQTLKDLIFRPTATASGTTLTLGTNDNVLNTFTGSSTATWTLPTPTNNAGAIIPVINGGTANIVVTSASGSQITNYQPLVVGGSLTTAATFTVTPGYSATFICDGTTWWAIQASSLKPVASYSGTTQTLAIGNSLNLFTGSSTATWTLPTPTGNTGVVIPVLNAGTATINVTSNSGSQINLSYVPGAGTAIAVDRGQYANFICDGTLWQAFRPAIPRLATITGTTSAIALSGGDQLVVFTGSSPTTFTLPQPGRTAEITLKNQGSATLTVTSASGSQIYTSSAQASVTVTAGNSLRLVADTTYWNSV